jgi:hypothetical protein
MVMGTLKLSLPYLFFFYISFVFGVKYKWLVIHLCSVSSRYGILNQELWTRDQFDPITFSRQLCVF